LTICTYLHYNVIIMNDAAMTIRTDTKTKQTIADFAASLGLSTSAFVTAVTLQAVREQRVVLTSPMPTLEPTPYLEKIMRKADADLKEGRNVSKAMNRDEAREHLRSLM
jgi:antitoxin component of RelBE/YafQ-DinJ toxin-antitoxin module